MRRMEKSRSVVRVGIFEIICLSLIVISSVSISLLALGEFNSYMTIGLSAIIFLGFFLKYHKRIEIKRVFTAGNIILFFILLIALFFRVPPYLHVIGGAQDQGTYVIMSEWYSKKGSAFIHDDIRAKITNSSLLSEFDLLNQFNNGHRNWGIHFYSKDRKAIPGVYAFRFYPLHPLWMSIFSNLFGGENRVYSLVFFSLISIAAFFLIAFELSNGALWPAAVVGILLAVNPLHVFFSKLPVSEMVALAFISSSLYFLLRYFNQGRNQNPNSFYLFLSAGLIGCLFFTRITGFFYIPFFYFLTVITILYLPRNRVRKSFLLYFASVSCLYILSVLYGYYYSPTYWRDIHSGLIKSIEKSLFIDIYVIIGALVVIFFLLDIAQKKNFSFVNRIKEILKEKRGTLLFTAFFLVVVLSLYNAYEFAFTTAMKDKMWHWELNPLVGLGLKSLTHTNLFVLMLYLSIPLFLLIFPAMYTYSKKDIRFFVLCSFLTLISAIHLHRTTPFQYYYSRYLVEAFVPFFLLICCLFLWDFSKRTKFTKILAYSILIFTLLNFIYYSLYQMNGRVAEGAHESLMKIKEQISDNDLLLVQRDGFSKYMDIRAALDYYYHINVLTLKNLSNLTHDKLLVSYLPEYDNIYILSKENFTEEDFKLNFVKNIEYTETEIERNKRGLIPTNYRNRTMELFLYKLDKEKIVMN